MTRDDVIRLAREAGLRVGDNLSGVQLVGAPGFGALPLLHLNVDELAAFAALVTAAERERCAQVCDAEASVEGIAQRCAANIRALKDGA